MKGSSVVSIGLQYACKSVDKSTGNETNACVMEQLSRDEEKP
jgi:hypothetical protein